MDINIYVEKLKASLELLEGDSKKLDGIADNISFNYWDKETAEDIDKISANINKQVNRIKGIMRLLSNEINENAKNLSDNIKELSDNYNILHNNSIEINTLLNSILDDMNNIINK